MNFFAVIGIATVTAGAVYGVLAGIGKFIRFALTVFYR